MMPPDRERLNRAAARIEAWLDTHEPDVVLGGPDDECLLRIGELAVAQACESDIADAIVAARDNGWCWEPIAVLLNASPEDTRHRVNAK